MNSITPLSIARTWDGTREIPGNDHNPIIVGWIHTAGGNWIHDDETPWCSAFVFVIVKQCEGCLPKNGLRARQWLTVGKPVDLVDAVPGWDVVVMTRGIGMQPGPSVIDAPGHVAFFNGWLEDSMIRCFGGNYNDMVCNAGYPVGRILGIRRMRGDI